MHNRNVHRSEHRRVHAAHLAREGHGRERLIDPARYFIDLQALVDHVLQVNLTPLEPIRFTVRPRPTDVAPPAAFARRAVTDHLGLSIPNDERAQFSPVRQDPHRP